MIIDMCGILNLGPHVGGGVNRFGEFGPTVLEHYMRAVLYVRMGRNLFVMVVEEKKV